MTFERFLLVMVVLATALPAQWINYPTSGIPRTPDGKPNLTAPTPRAANGKPDLSGLWGYNPGAYGVNVVADLAAGDIQPRADSLYKQRMERLGRDFPYCLPSGLLLNLNPFTPVKIVQTPTLILILSEDLSYRQVFLDGRALPEDPNPSFMGYSVGRWEDDTLVVESNGFNERLWLDGGGHPHTEALRITERYRRRDFGHMEIRQTYEDPSLYKKPWTITINATFIPDTELIEFVCAENEKDRPHLVGTASDDKKYEVKVAPELLSKYVGTYEFFFPENPTNVIHYNVTLTGDELFIDTEGKDKWPLIPLSETVFSMIGDRLEFKTDTRGAVTHLNFIAAEGDLQAVRAPGAK